MNRLRDYNALLAAFVVTLVAFALRLPNHDRHLPHSPEPDTHLVTYLIARARGEDPITIDRRTGFYANLLPELVLRIPGLTILERPDPTASLAEHLRAASRPYIVLRIMTGVLAGCLPLITFILARRHLAGC